MSALRLRLWVILHLTLGVGWVGLLASRAGEGNGPGANATQVFTMLLLAGWFPSVGLACWQERHRSWRALMTSDLLAAGVLVSVAITAYVPLFFFNVAWFLPLALLPRGVLTEGLFRWLSRKFC